MGQGRRSNLKWGKGMFLLIIKILVIIYGVLKNTIQQILMENYFKLIYMIQQKEFRELN